MGEKLLFNDPYDINYENRSDKYGENDLFVKRWSPRSYKKAKLDPSIVESIFSAARWSQSCFNEQPWLFVTESGESDRELFLDLLLPRNREWAKESSLIGYIFSRKDFTSNGKTNKWADFDTGAAWMAMTLQARMFGLYTHGMAGIKKDEVFEKLNVPQDTYNILCGFLIGQLNNPEMLNELTQKREKPSPRKKLEEIWSKGVLK